MTTLPPHLKANGAMSEPFDPYRKWLGIPPKDQPPHHYRLLGIALFEDDPDVIENAAARQMSHVRTFQTSKQHGPVSQRLLTELSAAKVCLLDSQRKTLYDDQLRTTLAAEGKLSSADLTQAVSPDAEDAETVNEPEFPALRRGPEVRWRTGAAPEGATASLPVPIPMPPLASAAAAAPAFPALRRAAAPAARPHRRRRSTLPIVITVVSLLVLVGLSVAAILIGTQLNRPAANQPTSGRPRIETPSSGQTLPTENTAQGHHRPMNPGGDPAPTTFPIPAAESGIAPAPSVASTPRTTDSDDLRDSMRQALYRSEQALAERKDGEFQQHFVLAQQLVANDRLPEQAKFKEDVDDLRVLKELLDQFWATVRDSVNNKVAIGETIDFLKKHQFELIARDGELIEYKLDGEQRSSEIKQLEPKAAILIASKTMKLTEPATLLPAAAFLSIDPRATDDEKKLGKQLFAAARQLGKANPAVARQLGLSQPDEPITLDENFASQIPAPSPTPEPEIKPPQNQEQK